MQITLINNVPLLKAAPGDLAYLEPRSWNQSITSYSECHVEGATSGPPQAFLYHEIYFISFSSAWEPSRLCEEKW